MRRSLGWLGGTALGLVLLAVSAQPARGQGDEPKAAPPAAPSASPTAAPSAPGVAPQLVVSNAHQGRVELVIESDRFEQTFRVKAMSSAPTAVSKVELRVDPFRGEDGKEGEQPAARWNQPAGTIAMDSDQSFTIAATLKEPGRYETEIELRYADKRSTTPLVVTRKAPIAQPGIEVISSTVFSVTRVCPSFLSIGEGARELCDPAPSLLLSLRSNVSTPTTVVIPPEVISVSIKGAGDRKLQELRGKPALGAKAVGEATIKARDVMPLFVTALGLGDPGVHEGVVRVTVKDRLPLDVPFTLVVKDGFWWPAAVIALGALASYWVRKKVGDGRERMVWRRDIRRLVERLESATGDARDRPRALRVIAGLRAQLEALEVDVALGAKREHVEATFKLLSKKLDLFGAYLDAERRLGDLGSGASAANVDLQKKLDEIADALRLPSTDDDALKAAQTSLGAIGLDDAHRRTLAAELEEVRKAVNEARQKAGEALKKELDKALDALAEVERQLSAGALDGVRPRLDDARRLFMAALATSLARRMESAPQTGVAQDRWQALSKDVRRRANEVVDAKDAAGAARAFASLQRAWVEARVLRLEALIARAKTRVEGEDQDDDWKKNRLDLLAATVEKKLVELKDLARAGSDAAADAAADEAEKALQSFNEETFGDAAVILLAARGSGGPAHEAERAVLATLPPPAVLETKATTPPMTEAQLTRQIETNDLRVLVVLTIVAVASGLTLLWVSNETWGSFDDYLKALLWGFGLHLAGNKPFEGLLGMRDTMTRPGG
ncbi:MAG TPA: hypothetical protein VE093_22790 [Polyangiaceae bacterium]|nr:hypothetical protein [Polyangiaceae bacterium]